MQRVVRSSFLIGAATLACDGEPGYQPDALGTDEQDALEPRCTLHAQCSSNVCDEAAPGPGRCVSEARVLYVSAQCGDTVAATGARDRPYCQIRDAIAALPASGKDVIRVLPGFYQPFGVFGQKLSIFGPAGEGGSARVFEEDLGAVRVGDGADVHVDGFELGGPTVSALRCEATRGARVVVRRCTLRADSGTAVRASGCDVVLDKTDIRSIYGGIEFLATRYLVVNSFISGASERSAVRVTGGSGAFRFVTVSGNYKETSAEGPFACGDAAVAIQNSIVFDNRPYDTGSQFAGNCVLDTVVLGADTTTRPRAIHKRPTLVDGYRLPVDRANLDCCIDRSTSRYDTRWDIEGTPRPQGSRADIGAFEAREPERSPP